MWKLLLDPGAYIRAVILGCHPGPPLDLIRGAGIHGRAIEAVQTWIPDRKARAPETFGFRARLTSGMTGEDNGMNFGTTTLKPDLI